MEITVICRRTFLAATCAAAIVPEASAQTVDSKRLLLIGLDYRGTPRELANPLNDCLLVERAARELPRVESVQRLFNPGVAELRAGVGEYARALQRNDVGIIYIAGHGAQVRGENFLLLADGRTLASIADVIEVVRQSTDTLIVLLDICRTDPRSTSIVDASVARTARGFAAVAYTSPDDVVLESVSAADLQAGRLAPFSLTGAGLNVVFATDPNNVAEDASNRRAANSPFADAIARHIGERNSFDEIIRNVTGDVVRATRRRQTPWAQGSIDRQIYLAGPPRNPNAPDFRVPG